MKKIDAIKPKAPLKGELKRVPIKQVISREQVRKHFANIDELAKSILMEGLHTPITVEYDGNERYVILQGERRWRACLLAGLTEIDVIVREPIENEVRRMLAQLTENIQREEMTCEEIALAIHELMNKGLSVRDIGKALGKGKDWAYVYASIAELPNEVKSVRDKHDINDPYVLRPLKQMFELDKTVASALIERAEANHYRLSRTNANSLLKQVQVAVRRKSKGPTHSQKLRLQKKKEKVNFGCVPSDEVCVYCWVRLPGQKAYQLGRIATDRVTKDPEFVCVFVQAEYHVVSILDVAIAGVKDRKESIDDLL